jgi:hypothetical protein
VLGLSFVGRLAGRSVITALLIAGWLLGWPPRWHSLRARSADFRDGVAGIRPVGLRRAGDVEYITAARGRTVSTPWRQSTPPSRSARSSPALGGWIADNWGLPAVYRSALVFIAISSALVFLLGERRGRRPRRVPCPTRASGATASSACWSA